MLQVTAREIHELVSNQEETDTRVVLYLQYAAKLGYKSAVVRTPDTYIFCILLHHAQSIALTIYLDTGTGKHRQIVNVSEIAEMKGADYCTMILGLYVFTGEDVTSTEPPQVPCSLPVRFFALYVTNAKVLHGGRVIAYKKYYYNDLIIYQCYPFPDVSVMSGP